VTDPADIKRLPDNPPHPFVFDYHDQKLRLRKTDEDGLGAVYVDFCAGPNQYRRLFGGGRNQAIAKAIGARKGKAPKVVDATAGMGRDAFVLASLGCRVHMIERSPVIAALLEDGLKRAQNDLRIGSWVKERLSLAHLDSRKALFNLPFKPDCIYLDPMYPVRRRSARVKKETYILQSLIEIYNDADDLFSVALNIACERVVVKRPIWAKWLADRQPQTSIRQIKHRYDIYRPEIGV